MMMYHCAPIVIICKDRINYLNTELLSLSATSPLSTRIFLSNDGTRNTEMLKYLTSNDSVSMDNDWKFPCDNQEWDDLIGRLPNPPNVDGVKNKVHVLAHSYSSGTQNIGLSVKYVFDHTPASHVIKMEDDLVFCQGWYFSLLKAIRNSGCDLLSGFRYFYGKPKTKPLNDDVQEMTEGYCGGQLMICSRHYFESCWNVFNNDITTVWDNDDLWINECRKANLKFGVLNRSVCQHVGFCTESGQKAFTKNGKLLKVDREFHNFQLAKNVATFGGSNFLLNC